nr:MAG TPA: hypothetical protein [Caudoviricetes sp.]
MNYYIRPKDWMRMDMEEKAFIIACIELETKEREKMKKKVK